MGKRIHKLTLKEYSLLPGNIFKKIKGLYTLEIDEKTFYGFHSAKDIHKSLKPQKFEPYINNY